MGRCNNDALLRKITKKPIDKNLTEVDMMLYGQLPDCRRIDTRHFVSAGTGYTYNKFDKPENRFECLRNGCVNTGTLTLGSASDKLVVRTLEDATEWASGVITFYVKGTGTVTVEVSDDETFTNADKYTVTVASVLDDGFSPVVVDLSQAPTEVGDGWTPSTNGAYIRLSGSAKMGFSSVGIFDSIADFALNDVVKLGCLSNIGGTYDISALERACAEAMYDPSGVSSFSQTITARRVSGNYWKLNALNSKGEAAEGFEMVTKEFTIASGGDYGVVTLNDFFEDECGGVAIQMSRDCSVVDSALKQISIPVPVALDEDQFQIIHLAEGVEIHFNASLVGEKASISYPKTVNVEEYVGNTDNLNTVKVRMSYPVIIEDGPDKCIKEVHVFDHVLVTSFPANITEADTEFSFTVQIYADADGNFYKVRRILD